MKGVAMFRTLKAEEIECRIQSVKDDGLILLLYKDARCDMNILDETVGPLNWKREHTRDNANCIVSIYNKDLGEWISKEDTGTESNTEKEKGLASDSFKRACVNWGIGRELYTSPFIWITPDGYTKTKDGRVFDRFYVSEIGYDEDRNINRLAIKNSKTKKVVFTYGISTVKGYPSRDEMLNLARQKYPNDELMQKLLDSFKVEKLEDATDEQLINIWKRYRG
jgi:hypothetical protein